MRITEKTWVEYIDRLSRLNEEAGQKMADYITSHGTQDVDRLIAYADALVQKYGEGTAELACQMYDAVAQASGVTVPPAEPAAPADYGETAKMVNATRQSPPQLQGGVRRLVKRAGADTTLKNAIRDGAEWAWVPHGDTCPFCLTLASRGWQKASAKALKGGHAEHIHAHCNCEYAIRFDSNTTVAGYDPDKYLEQYNAAGGDINAMRRAQYAENRDVINAQKRAAYALRQKNRGKKVVITDIAVEKVPKVFFGGISKEMAETVQQAHKDLLKFAKDHNDNNEVAALLDLRTGERLPFVKGDSVSVNIEADADSYHWLRTKPERSILLIHNHPGQRYFSLQDVVVFAQNPAVGAMSIATNQGKVWTISKTPKFNRDDVFGALLSHRNATEGEWDDIIDKLLKSGYDYGIERS